MNFLNTKITIYKKKVPGAHNVQRCFLLRNMEPKDQKVQGTLLEKPLLGWLAQGENKNPSFNNNNNLKLVTKRLHMQSRRRLLQISLMLVSLWDLLGVTSAGRSSKYKVTGGSGGAEEEGSGLVQVT